MLDQICGHIHNYFPDAENIRAGYFAVVDGSLTLNFLKTDQYFRIVGSLFNDGVYQYPAEGLTDEDFYGEIWPMRPPKDFLRLCDEIAAWQEKNGQQMASPFTSENIIGVYSYTKDAGAGGSSGSAWEHVFKSQLNRWRRLS